MDRFKKEEALVNKLIHNEQYELALAFIQKVLDICTGVEVATFYELRAMIKSLEGDHNGATADCYAANEELKKDRGFFKYSHAACIFGESILARGEVNVAVEFYEEALRRADSDVWREKFKSYLSILHDSETKSQMTNSSKKKGKKASKQSVKRDDKQFSGHIAAQQLEIQSKPADGKGKRGLEHGLSASGQGDGAKDSDIGSDVKQISVHISGQPLGKDKKVVGDLQDSRMQGIDEGVGKGADVKTSDIRVDQQISGHITGQPLQKDKQVVGDLRDRLMPDKDEDVGEVTAVKTRASEDNTKRSIKYDVSFKFVYDEETSLGAMESENIELTKSLLPISEVQKIRFLALEQLCSSHPNLLTVVHVLRLRPDMQVMMIVELVYSFQSFFKEKFREFSLKTTVTKAGWWNWVKDIFRIYFRDVIRALLYLNSRKQACGNLSFNMFATNAGHGRILPSMIADVQGNADLKDLISQMKTSINFPFLDDERDKLEEYAVPADLIKFLNRTKMSGVPASFHMDHPYFWSKAEKFGFVMRLKDLIHMATFKLVLNFKLFERNHFKDWSTKLEGPFLEVWRKGDPNHPSPAPVEGMVKVQPYAKRIDIVRYFFSAYRHLNDEEYKVFREKMYTSDEIEAELSRFFPDFYVILYECIEMCVREGTIKAIHLKELASCQYSDDGESSCHET